MNCIKCGKEINENAKFCNNCGEQIIVEKETNTSTSSKDIEKRIIELSELNEYEGKKVAVINEIKEEYNLSLLDAKRLVEDVLNGVKLNENIKNNIEYENSKIHTDETSDYELILLNRKENEEKIDYIIEVITVIGCIIGCSYYMRNGEEFLIALLSGGVLITAILFVCTPVVNFIKKDRNCYEGIKKYERFFELKNKIKNIDVAIQTVELEFSEKRKKHGILYYLLCILAVIMIFSLC